MNKTMTEAQKARLRKLGLKGGAANKAKHSPQYFKDLGRLGGLACQRQHGKKAEMIRARLAASEKGRDRLRAIIAAGKTVFEITGQ